MSMSHRLLTYAKGMRREPTEAEGKVWRQLRAHRFAEWKFKRQQPIGHYIVDFVCFEHRLIVEIDGGQHVEQRAYDDRRTHWLNTQGFTVLRFWNHDVLGDSQTVLDAIWQALEP
jgi:adenine-specific DNA-methyltransferase